MNELVPVETCRIVARPHLFKAERIERTVKAGGTRTAVFEVGGLDSSKLPKWN